MILLNMKNYDFYKYGENDAYGQPQLSEEVQGQVKMAIYLTSQNTQDNILYKGATYVGLTNDAEIDDKYVIQNGNERLKVLYVQHEGRWKQVFMAGM